MQHPSQRDTTGRSAFLNLVHSLEKTEFDLGEVYAFESKLERLHPANRHIRDKIRQQLQVLRDLGLLQFLGRGDYRLRWLRWRSVSPVFTIPSNSSCVTVTTMLA
jgi:hypothetical protein